MTLTDRCENWSEVYRDRMRAQQAKSFEGRYRSGQSEHWLYGQAPPTTPPDRDYNDAQTINDAWKSIPDAFHQAILGGWYVRRWSPRKIVTVAREVSGEAHQRREVDFDPYLAMGHALLQEQLDLPAVFRRERLADRVRKALDLEVWRRADTTNCDPLVT